MDSEQRLASDNPDVVGLIVGSAFSIDAFEANRPEPIEVNTPWGSWTLYRLSDFGRPCYLSFRHEYPHRLLPNQIPYRAQIEAFNLAGCRTLLCTSSVGVLDESLPLDTPLVVSDIVTLDNRLPDGSSCTMFDTPSALQGHLVIGDGLLSTGLSKQLREMVLAAGYGHSKPVIFGYVGGPRTKSAAENLMWRHLGAQVNSMTLAPEIILANERQITCAALVSGHKPSRPGTEDSLSEREISDSLVRSQGAMLDIAKMFLQSSRHVDFGNHLYRFKRTIRLK